MCYLLPINRFRVARSAALLMLTLYSQLTVGAQVAHAFAEGPVLLWGVDSCSPYTNPPVLGPGLWPEVTLSLGRPDFWARYLTDSVCPSLSSAEIQAAHTRHMGILPIFNEADCSQVQGRAASTAYATNAVIRAVKDEIPTGRAIAVDIEPVGGACPGAAHIDKGFIEGWFDTISLFGYVPAFYGNTIPYSAFANAWCAAVAERPDIAPNSYLWSFEPSMPRINHAARNAPAFNPYNPLCAGRLIAWQYSLSTASHPDVDVDLAYSNFPFWYP